MACSAVLLPEDRARTSTNQEIMASPGGDAIGGYDPVSYFVAGEPQRGLPEFSYRWRGASWQFSTSANRDLFVQEPAKYSPVYGGWCASGMAEGYAAETDPVNAWTVYDGKLYLNWDKGVAETWREEIENSLERSELHWPEIQRDLQAGGSKIYWHDDE